MEHKQRIVVPDSLPVLAEVTSEALIDELVRRHKGIIVALLNEKQEGAEEFSLYYGGGGCLALGILVHALAKLRQVSVEKSHPEEDEEGD